MKVLRSLFVAWLAVAALLAGSVHAQDSSSTPFKSEELEALVAPIALYPDSLLSQVLMASTYPLEIVQAARWAKANPGVSGDAALKKVENETWDVSVKSLTAFPNVLEMMNEKLDWTQKLGDAFIGQQKDVLAAVQRMRQLAQKNGNLESNQQQVVKTEAQTIIIEPAQPQTIYVPAYNPTVVYGAWPYPAYPPYYYPGVAYWYPGQALVRGFAWGVGFAAAGAIFGGCNWGRGDVNINVNKAANIDRNFNRNTVGSGGNWQHNPKHRGNTPYRDQASRDRFGDKRADSARNEFRGRDGDGIGGDRGADRGDRGGRDGIGGDRGGDRGDLGDRGGRDGIGGDRGGRDGISGGDRGGRDGISGGDRSNFAGDRGGNALSGADRGSRDADRGRASAGSMSRDGGGRAASAGGGSRSFSGGGGGSRSFSGGGGGGRAGGGGGRGGGGRR